MTAGRLRPLTAADLPAAEELSAAAFADLDRRRGRGGRTRPAFSARWRHLLATDPDGAWIAEDEEGPAGVALALRRGPLWGLSMLAVRIGAQGNGLGRALLEAALRTAEGAACALIASSTDERAIRRYARAGFTLRPALSAYGTPRPSAAPGTRLGTAADLDLTEAVDRRVRGAERAHDLATVLGAGGRLVVADAPGRGYAVLGMGLVFTLAADDERTAARVLARALAEAGGPTEVRWLDAAQAWAVPVLLDAGLTLVPSGPLCVRGRPPPLTPYLPSGPYL